MQQAIKKEGLQRNVKTLNRGDKFENVKNEKQKNEVSVLDVTEVR